MLQRDPCLFPAVAACSLADLPLVSPCRGQSRVHDGVCPNWPFPAGKSMQAHPHPPGTWLDLAVQLHGTGMVWEPRGWDREEGRQLDGQPQGLSVRSSWELEGGHASTGACPRAVTATCLHFLVHYQSLCPQPHQTWLLWLTQALRSICQL